MRLVVEVDFVKCVEVYLFCEVKWLIWYIIILMLVVE